MWGLSLDNLLCEYLLYEDLSHENLSRDDLLCEDLSHEDLSHEDLSMCWINFLQTMTHTFYCDPITAEPKSCWAKDRLDSPSEDKQKKVGK